jgi:hypothetical protein
MATTAAPFPIDPAVEAGRLADLFHNWSNDLDNYRIGLPDNTPPKQVADLKVKAQTLEGQSQRFTAEAIGATLQSVQTDLGRIKDVTQQAKDQLAVLDDVSKVIAITGLVVDLGTAIASGNPVGILSAVDTLAQAAAG